MLRPERGLFFQLAPILGSFLAAAVLLAPPAVFQVAAKEDPAKRAEEEAEPPGFDFSEEGIFCLEEEYLALAKTRRKTAELELNLERLRRQRLELELARERRKRLELQLKRLEKEQELALKVEREKGAPDVTEEINRLRVDIAREKENEKKALGVDIERAGSFQSQSRFVSGMSYYNDKNYDSAIEDFKVAAKLDPKDADIHLQLGLTYLAAKRYREAARSLKAAIHLEPDRARLHSVHGIALHRSGEIEAAVEAYKTALELNPNSSSNNNNLCLAYFDLDRYEEAVVSCQKALDISETNTPALYNMGLSKAKLGRTEEAIRSFEKAAKHSRKPRPEIHLNWGAALEKGGDKRAARKVYSKGLKLDPAPTLRKALEERLDKLQ